AIAVFFDDALVALAALDGPEILRVFDESEIAEAALEQVFRADASDGLVVGVNEWNVRAAKYADHVDDGNAEVGDDLRFRVEHRGDDAVAVPFTQPCRQ